MTETHSPTIWIDGDGAPRACKEIIFKASGRTGVPVVLVANRGQLMPRMNTVRFVQVRDGLDVADDHIAEHCQPGDLVITSDIPLAARVIEAGGTVIQFRGEALTETNVRQRLAMRDFMDDLRGGGVLTGGPPAYGPKDKQRFANALDSWLARNR
ncbi:MAG: YaiI/YqxD family protein [Myxococcota bacterium]|jgi:hypothetical protein|nr:YaiI/YqxD family protein [Myxococcota bacterium]